MHFKEKCCKSEAKMLKKDVESSLCIYDKAIRSLPLHTSTQRCDRCTHTHGHTQLAQRYDRRWCIHLHTDTIAAIAHTYTAIRSLSLHKPTQRYNRLFHTHTHTPTQRCNRCFFSLCPHTPTQTHNRCTSTQVSKAST